MADLCVPSDIGCEEREKKRKHHNATKDGHRRDNKKLKSLYCLRHKKIFFQDHEAASHSKEDFLLNQDNHEKKQSR